MKHRISVILFTVMLLCMAALQASAQRPPMMTAEERTKLLADSLALDKDQQAKVLDLYKEADKKREEVFNANSGDRDAMRSAMREVMETTDKQIEALLTAKQKTKYDEMKIHRMQRWQNRQQQPPPEKPKDESK
jgi:Spy/CpxP family protein refolding chaperone